MHHRGDIALLRTLLVVCSWWRGVPPRPGRCYCCSPCKSQGRFWMHHRRPSRMLVSTSFPDIALGRTLVVVCKSFYCRLFLFCKYWLDRTRIDCCTGLLVSRTIYRLHTLLKVQRGQKVQGTRMHLLLGECCQPPRARRASQGHVEEASRMQIWRDGSSIQPVGELIWPG